MAVFTDHERTQWIEREFNEMIALGFTPIQAQAEFHRKRALTKLEDE